MISEALLVWSEQPLNAETPLHLLCRSQVTATELFFVRSHGPVPAIDPQAYRLRVAGAVERPLELSLDDLRSSFPRATVTAALACAGNRRQELGRVDAIPDAVPWGAGAIGNASWGGVRLGHVLAAAGVTAEGRHVAFTGLDDAEAQGRRVAFGGSIPLEKALAPETLLADEMNGAPLPPEHGFPVRALVPGYIGARSVKWLSEITVQRDHSDNFFQTVDYALAGVPLAELPLNAAICSPRDGAELGGPFAVEGYAVAGGAELERVEVSADGGRTWTAAELRGGGRWTWRRWRAELELAPGPHEIAVRAWDASGATQPEGLRAVWNARGYMNNAWHRIGVQA
jgi:sulfite oxidase